MAIPDAIIDTIRRELDRAAIVATADGGSLLLTERTRIGRQFDMSARLRVTGETVRETGWTAEDEA